MKMSDILGLRASLAAGAARLSLPAAAGPAPANWPPKCGMAWAITGLIVVLGMSTPAPAQIAPARTGCASR